MLNSDKTKFIFNNSQIWYSMLQETIFSDRTWNQAWSKEDDQVEKPELNNLNLTWQSICGLTEQRSENYKERLTYLFNFV